MDKRHLLGKRLRELRKRNDFTLAELAEKINIEPSSLGNIENGYNYPKVATLEALSVALNCTIGDFFEFEHHCATEDLIAEICKMLQAHPDKVSDVYKMVKALIK